MERKRPHSKTPPRRLASSDEHAMAAGTSASTSAHTEGHTAVASSSTGQHRSSTIARTAAPILSLPDYSTQLMNNRLMRDITQQRRPVEYAPDAQRPRTTLDERKHGFETELSGGKFHFVFIDTGYNQVLEIDPAQTVLQNDGEVIIRASKPITIDGVSGRWTGRMNRHSLQGDMIFVPNQPHERPPPPSPDDTPSSTTLIPTQRRRTTSPSAARKEPAPKSPVLETTDVARRTSESSESTLTPAPETAESPGKY